MAAMLEITLALVAVVVIGFAVMLITPPFVTTVGMGALLLGLLVGVPTGLWYHVLLYRFVSAKTLVPRLWWLSPSELHRHLNEAEQQHIAPWYRVGGLGFVLSALGGLTAIVGLLMAR